MAISPEDFVVVTPTVCTSDGKDAKARATRFCTFTVSISASVPCSN